MSHNDLTDQRFGHLTVKEVLTTRDSGRRALCRCLCDCGGEALKRIDKLRAAERAGREPCCHACAIKRRAKHWRLTRERHSPMNNPNAPAEMITHLNYAKYLRDFTPLQWRRFFAIVERHREAAADEHFGMDQVRAEAVDLIILEPFPVEAVDVSLHERRNYSYLSRGGEI